jgi:dihydrofolate reductase
MGANIPQQSLAEGLVDEVLLHVVPLLLGEGIRLFAGPPHSRSPCRRSASDSQGK